MPTETVSSSPTPRTHWILIRGLARESRHWGEFPRALEESFRDLGAHGRVDAIDLPGTGRYSEMRSPASIPEITEFAREKYLEIRRAQRERGQEPANETYLVAISLGGMVASHWLERWPEDFKGCVLINTSFKDSPVFKRLAPMSLKHFFDIARSSDPFEREKNVLKMVSNRPDRYDTVAAEWAKIHTSRPVSYENFALQLLAASRYSPSLDLPPVPTLILCSTKDRMVHPSCSMQIAERWRADVRKHPTAGHDLPIDDPPWVVAEIREWWRSLHAKRNKDPNEESGKPAEGDSLKAD